MLYLYRSWIIYVVFPRNSRPLIFITYTCCSSISPHNWIPFCSQRLRTCWLTHYIDIIYQKFSTKNHFLGCTNTTKVPKNLLSWQYSGKARSRTSFFQIRDRMLLPLLFRRVYHLEYVCPSQAGIRYLVMVPTEEFVSSSEHCSQLNNLKKHKYIVTIESIFNILNSFIKPMLLITGTFSYDKKTHIFGKNRKYYYMLIH